MVQPFISEQLPIQSWAQQFLQILNSDENECHSCKGKLEQARWDKDQCAVKVQTNSALLPVCSPGPQVLATQKAVQGHKQEDSYQEHCAWEVLGLKGPFQNWPSSPFPHRLGLFLRPLSIWAHWIRVEYYIGVCLWKLPLSPTQVHHNKWISLWIQPSIGSIGLEGPKMLCSFPLGLRKEESNL